MLNLSRVIKPWKEADALSAHINLYGFWTETAFLTKSGDLGMVLSVAGVDYESLDSDEQQYAVKRLESALKAFGEGFHVYQYLFKTNWPVIPFARYDDELIDAAIDQRHQYFESKRDRLYEVELFYVIVLEGARSKTGILSALARMPRDPQGAIRELKAQFCPSIIKCASHHGRAGDGSYQEEKMATTPDITGGIDCEESRIPQLKPIEETLQKLVHRAFASGGERGQAVKNFLNGTWIGEPLHVILTDIPIGAWTVALVFDGLDLMSHKREFAVAADASIGIGLAGAVGAAVTGVTDWQDADAPARRLGMIHGLLNVSATALFITSLVLRKKKSRTSGRVFAGLGYAVMSIAAHLGGKMVYEHRVGVDRTDGAAFPQDFVPVMAESDLAEAKPTRAEHDGVPILLVRRGDRIFALAETCSHFNGPLSEGKLVGDSIVCPWHASRFTLEDGRVLDGPAVHPQPCLQVRIQNGQIEIRKLLCDDAKPARSPEAESAGAGQPA